MSKKEILPGRSLYYEELINGYQARVPIRWSWKEGWEISMFLMPFSQPDKPVKNIPNRISKMS